MRRKMKNVVVMILSLALIGAVLTGCGESPQSGQQTQQGIPERIPGETEQGQDTVTETAETETEEKQVQEEGKSVETSEEYEDNFAVDSEAAKEFAQKVKDVTAKKDLNGLAELTAFPVYVGLPDVDVVETKEDFVKLGADAVFKDTLMESVEMADIDNLQPSMAGFSISDGGTANINFGVTDGMLAINGINY